jgi:hypothetical protein
MIGMGPTGHLSSNELRWLTLSARDATGKAGCGLASWPSFLADSDVRGTRWLLQLVTLFDDLFGLRH